MMTDSRPDYHDAIDQMLSSQGSDEEQDEPVVSNQYFNTIKEEGDLEPHGMHKSDNTKTKNGHGEPNQQDVSLENNTFRVMTKEDSREPKTLNLIEEIKKEVPDQKESKKLTKRITYLNVTPAELAELGLGKCQVSTAALMRSKPVDIFIIILILLYTLLVIVYLAIEDIIEDDDTVVLSLQIVELIFLFIFCIEITLNLIGFGVLFLKDYWNIADITVIILAIAFVALDMSLDNSDLSGLFKLRGLFRLLRVGILIRKFDAIRKKSAARKSMAIRDIYHMTSPAEIVKEILCGIRDMIDNDDKLLEDINYCIKMVSSGKLYETDFLDAVNANDEKSKDAMSWVKSIQGNKKEGKRSSKDSVAILSNRMHKINIDEALSLTAESKIMLRQVDSLDFDVFNFKELVEEKELFVVSSYLMHKHDLFSSLSIDPEVYFKFISRIQDYYNPGFVEYHNKTHGTDVCQTSYFFLSNCEMLSICDVNDMEFASIIISTACHDFEHPGVNNPFLIESRSPWAIEYNDKSPLENHHIASSFSIINSEGYNIFKDIDNDDYKVMRKNMVEIVLGTDAAHHFTELAKFKQRISSDDFSPKEEDKLVVFKMAVHLADISNPVKNFNLALLWTGLLYDEFFKQGDQEAKMGRNKSYLMDRHTTNIAGCSIGFINMLVKPAYEALVEVLPKADVCLDNMQNNIDRWEELKEEFKKRMESKKNLIPESRGLIKQANSSLPVIPAAKAMSPRYPSPLEVSEANMICTTNRAHDDDDDDYP